MNPGITDEEEKRYLELQRMALDYARQGETGDLEKMLQMGMPVNLADHKGNTLLMLASYNGEWETVRMLIRMGADVNRKNDRGQTPLGGVAFKGYPDITRELIEAGAQIQADNGAGMRPAHFAAMFGNFEVLQLLENAEKKSGDTNKVKARWRLMPSLASVIGRIRFFFKKK